MADNDVALAIIRKDSLQRINFLFPGGSGDVLVDGASFRRIADLIVKKQMNVAVDPTLSGEKGTWDHSKNILTVKTMQGRDAEATVIHECLHGLFDIELTPVLVAPEEAACYIVDLCYYKMTGYKESRYLQGKAKAIYQAAQPVAKAVLAGSVTGFGRPTTVDPANFAKIVTAVLAIPEYAANAAGGASYPHDG